MVEKHCFTVYLKQSLKCWLFSFILSNKNRLCVARFSKKYLALFCSVHQTFEENSLDVCCEIK